MEIPATFPALALSDAIGMALQFVFAMLRPGAFLLSAPFFSARFIPLPVRIVLTVGLTVAVIGIVPMPAPEALADLAAIRWVFVELALGVSAGLLLQIVFAAAAMAGDWIAATAGLAFAAQVDPTTGTQSPVISQLMTLFLLGIFLAVDGHLVAIGLVLRSYEILPPGAPVAGGALIAAGIEAGSAMFTFAARLMLPVVSVLLILNVVIGVVTRSAPQLNIFAFGFPLTISATMLLLFLNAPAQAPVLAQVVDTVLGMLEAMLGAAADG